MYKGTIMTEIIEDTVTERKKVLEDKRSDLKEKRKIEKRYCFQYFVLLHW